MSKASKFVNYLISLEGRRDTGAMAALRRGLNERPGDAIEMYPYVARWGVERAYAVAGRNILPGRIAVRAPSEQLVAAGRRDIL